MCCIFCASLRGASYFGTSAQILLGLGIITKYGTTLPEFKWEELNTLYSGPSLFIFLYGLFLLIFGCVVFRAIEIESLRLLKVFVGSLTVFQSLVLVTHLTLLALSFDSLGDEERIAQVTVLSTNLVLTFLQLTTLYLYMIRLARREWFHHRQMGHRDEESSSGASVPLSSTSGNTNLISLTSKGQGPGVGISPGQGPCSVHSTGRVSVTSFGQGQRYVDGQWENLH